MSMILGLQRLVPKLDGSEMNTLLVSTVSSVCPTTNIAGDQPRQFEWE
jgi:hypothetical protein